MKVSNLEFVHANFQTPNFKSERVTPVMPQGHDTYIPTRKTDSNSKAWWVIGSLAIAGIGAFLAHKAGWFKKAVKETENKIDDILQIEKFTKVDEAKEYFEKLGIETDFRGVNEGHLDMLNRIKENIKQLKEMGVKKEKPDSITISDWKNKEETQELFRKRGSVNEKAPESGYYMAFSVFGKNDEAHILIDSNKPYFDNFRHEMGNVNHHRGLDSYWHSKGVHKREFVDKQLEILGSEERIYKGGINDGIISRNLIEKPIAGTDAKFCFPTEKYEVRYVYPQGMIDRMQLETNAYDNGKTVTEQIAYIFEGLLKGKQFSDEVMLYYDFSGGARIPNLKITTIPRKIEKH